MILLRICVYFEDEAERSSSWLFTGIDALSCLQTRFGKSLHPPQFMIIFKIFQERHVQM